MDGAVAMSAYLRLGEMPSVIFARGVAHVHQRRVEARDVGLGHREREPQRRAGQRCVPASGVALRDGRVLVADDHLRAHDAGPAERESHEGENKQRCRRGNHNESEKV